MGNSTLNNFRLNEDKKIINFKILIKLLKILEKNNNKKGPGTQKGKGKAKNSEKFIDKTFSQNEKFSLVESFTNKATKTKKIEYVYEKNNHSKTLILNSLYDIDERKERYIQNKNKNINKNKEIKGIIYKKDKKMAFSNLNNQPDKVDEKKNQVFNNNKIVDRNKVLKNKEDVANISKLFDDMKQDITKTLSKIQKKDFIKEKNKNLDSIEKYQKNNTKILINAIKDVNIKETEINEKDNKHYNNNSKEKISNKNEISEDINNIKTNKDRNTKDFTNDFNKKDIQLKENKPKQNNNVNDIKIRKFSILNNFNINIEFEDIIIFKIKRNKSLFSIKLKHNIAIIAIKELIWNKSNKIIM